MGNFIFLCSVIDGQDDFDSHNADKMFRIPIEQIMGNLLEAAVSHEWDLNPDLLHRDVQ